MQKVGIAYNSKTSIYNDPFFSDVGGVQFIEKSPQEEESAGENKPVCILIMVMRWDDLTQGANFMV
jgi:hypothetical protein